MGKTVEAGTPVHRFKTKIKVNHGIKNLANWASSCTYNMGEIVATSIWNEIERWMQAHAKPIYDTLGNGALDSDIRQVEDAIGAKLPPDVIATYRIHNGQCDEAAWSLASCLFERRWYSTDAILTEWQMMKCWVEDGEFNGLRSQGPAEIACDLWWNLHWLPITGTGNGDFTCLDLSPGLKGSYGQVITFWHTSSERRVQASSWSAWLILYERLLKQGYFMYSEEQGGIVLRPEKVIEYSRIVEA
jgi:cell wall assembly regulator SMI1